MSTPAHIVPEWYFWPFYAILRAFTQDFFFIPAKLWGVLAMFSAILLLFFLPWLDTLAGALGQLPAGVPQVLLDPGRRRRRARLSAAASRPKSRIVHDQPARGGLLLRPLPGHPAARLRIERPLRCRTRSPRRCSAQRHRRALALQPARHRRAARPGERRHMIRCIGILVGLVFVVALLWCVRAGAHRPSPSRQSRPPSRAFHVEPKDVPAPATVRSARSTAPAPARLSGLQGSLLGLPLAAPGRVPRPEDLGYQRRPGEGARQAEYRRSPVDRPQHRRSRRRARASRPTTSRSPSPTTRRARRQQQRAAARPVADHQGARGRPGLRLFAADRLPDPAGRAAQAVPRRQDARRACTTTRTSPNLNIAMPPPLTADGQVTYTDGTKPTVDQMAKDVAAFLRGPPSRRSRSATRPAGAVLGFLLFATILGTVLAIWRDKKH